MEIDQVCHKYDCCKLLSQEKKIYKSLFENNHAVMLLINPETSAIVDANLAACSFYGYSKSELIAMKITEINSLPEEEVFEEIQKAKLEHKNHFTFTHILASGELRYIEVYSSPIEIDNKKLLYSIVFDISEKKETLNKLEESEKKFKQLFNNANDVIFFYELRDDCIPEGVIDVNDYAFKKLGYTKDELLLMLPKDTIDEETYRNIAKMAKELCAKGRSTLEMTHMAKDGTIIPFEVKSHLFIFNNKKVAISIGRDITNRKKREHELRLQKSYFQQLFKNSPEAIAILNNGDRIIDINKAFSDLFNYSIDDIRNVLINDIIVPNDYKEEASNNTRIVADGGVVRRESIRKNKEGRLINVDILSYPIVHDGKQIGIYAIYRDITDEKLKERKIETLAVRDSLTGLYNRYTFVDRLNIEIEKANESRQDLAIMFIDVDGFKSINDNLGHISGDKVLRVISKRIRKCLGRDDIVGRVGGDEFIVLSSNIKDSHEIVRKVKKIMSRFEKPIYIKEYKFYITISIGIAFYPINGLHSEALIKNADVAMYRAKEYSGNRYEFYTSNLHEKIKEEFIIVNALRKAQERGEFSLYYQPIVDLRTNKIVGAEALIRWEHPEHGYISPSKFIPIAENRGFIAEIGKWVLKEACLQNKKWQALGFSPIFIAVNISVKQLEQDEFIDIVKEILNETELDSKYLELEITESISIENIRNRLFVLSKLRDIGVKLSIDDFGTGFSSLSQLNKLCISKLKIDRSFIRDINIDSNNTAIVSTIIAIARKLKLNVVAEGVETREQLDYLNMENCDMVQGYFYSPPVPPDLFEDIVRKCNESKDK
ncbi:sensor domain-containing protein [Wukongibacter sp. M2B1]|uniref:sensor domain-containing protein n=1 Tax=Wukongibacter sp. M2B1 TaxID=3088895 RepID=UPI003D79A46A